MKFATVTAMILSASVALVSPGIAASPVKLGELTCEVSSEDDKLLQSSIVLDCSYIDAGGNNARSYKGKIERAGLDFGTIKAEQIHMDCEHSG